MVNIQTINVGLAANDKKGDPLRDAMQKVNLNFSALNTAIQGVLDGKGQANGYASLGADGRLLAAQAPVVYSAALPTTTHDLNTYVTPGTFYQATVAGATAPTGVNYPTAQVGFLEVVATGTPVLQVYTTRVAGAASQRFWRLRISSASWSIWKEGVDAAALAAVKSTADAAIPIAQKAAANGVGSLDASGRQPIGQLPAPILLPATAHDLDTYDQDGTFGQNATAGAVAGSNYPPEKVAGVLTVQRGGAGNIQAHQWYRTYFIENSTVYYRNKTTAGWGNWVRLAKFSEAMTHTFLTTATDANSLAADNTFYTFTSATPFTGGTNWPPTSNIIGGLVEVAYLDGGRVIQTCTLPVGNGKPRIFQRYGDPRAGGTWQTWRMIGAVSSTGWLPTADAGDVYVDGAGWYAWNGSAYARRDLSTLLPVTAHSLDTYTEPGEWYQGTSSSATIANKYPEGAALGFLSVKAFGAATVQEYSLRASASRKWWRAQVSAGTWSAWFEVANVGQAMTHTFLTAATDANTLIADNTWYSWIAAVVQDTNFPPYPAKVGGYIDTRYLSSGNIVQIATLNVGGNARAVVFQRQANSNPLVWSAWRLMSPLTYATQLPTADAGDAYVDGLGWYAWNASRSAYVRVPPTPNFRHGLKTVFGTGTTAITVQPGACASALGEVTMTLAAASTRTIQTSGAFVHGATGNGLLSGARTANTWYYIFLLRRNSDGDCCVAFDTAFNCANRPSTHSYYRRIGCVFSGATNSLYPYVQFGNEFWYATKMTMYNQAMFIANTVYTPNLPTPPNVAHVAKLTGFLGTLAGNNSALMNRWYDSGGGFADWSYVLIASPSMNTVNDWEIPVPAVATPVTGFQMPSVDGAASIFVKGYTDLFED